jgi:NADH-quinone oxidoreductase subunit M
MNDWIATILIFLPSRERRLLLFPVGGNAVASFAVLVSLVEVGFWIDAVTRFDFAHGLQFEQQASWFSVLNVSYHVGMFGFSLWLVGLSVVVMASAIAYAFLAGRERPRAYYGLMLLLTGAVVGVFTAQDLLLFYVMFEAMLIPLYVLLGVWGGAGRLGATFKFVAYTMAGSLLMLVSIIALGLTQGTFDIVEGGTSGNEWIFLGFAAAFAVGAAVPVPRLA